MKVCESCGGTFPCNPGACWCDHLDVPQVLVLELRNRYKGCLCEKCLKSLTEAKAAVPCTPDHQISKYKENS